MASETQQEKALHYLAEGRVKVVFADHANASFHCNGSDLYTTRFTHHVGWTCDCPARKPECVHVYACKLITDLHVDRAAVKMTTDSSVDELLGVLP